MVACHAVTLEQAKVATKAEVVAVVQETLSKFYCDICSKGYANVAQWEEHLLSYGHNHAKRKKEVAAQSRSIKNNADEINKRREKEKKREQKELERILKATGGSLPSSAPSGSGAPPLSSSAKAPAAPPAEKKKGGFFKVSGTPVPPLDLPQQPPPPPPDANIPPPPPASHDLPPPPPPPPASTASASLAGSAPKFTSSKTSNLKSTWNTWQPPPPTILPNIPAPPPSKSTSSTAFGPSSTWKPTSAPALHPLLAGESNVASTSADAPLSEVGKGGRWHVQPRDQRNDFFQQRKDERSDSPYELPTAASSINTQRMPKEMSFVSASTSSKPSTPSGLQTNPALAKAPGISLAGSAPARKKALDMMADEDDETDESSGMPLPTGRPKARMSGPPGSAFKGKIGFGSMGR